MAQRHAGIKVEMPREHPPYIKVDIEIGRYLRAYDLVLGVRLFIKSVPSKRHTEVPLIVEGNSLAAKDACSSTGSRRALPETRTQRWGLRASG